MTTRRDVFRIAWPIILANAAVPLLGLTDTAVIGNTGNAEDLGAIALGSLVFSFLYWSFGFLRMGTTGFTAQAAGSGDEAEVRASLGRAGLLAVAVALSLVALQWPLSEVAFSILGGSPRVESMAKDYFAVRIWGAPAALSNFALLGTLIGLGESRRLLVTQIFLNGTNAALDVLFVVGLGWGAKGIGAGTALAEWLTLALTVALVRDLLVRRRVDEAPFWDWNRIRSATAVRQMLGANTNIMVRTLLLLFGFGWFTNRSATFGDTVLAANHVLLQLVSFSAFFLDGYAHAAESLVGASVGARSTARLDAAVLRSTELAVATAVLLALGLIVGGETVIFALTRDEGVRAAAMEQLPLAVTYVALGVGAYQLDGVFIGATRTRDMRNASLVSLVVFLAAAFPMTHAAGNRGLWLAFTLYVVTRAVALGVRYPRLRRAVGGG